MTTTRSRPALLLLALAFAVPSVARAEEPPAGAPPVEPAGGPPQRGVQLQARMTTQLGVSSVLSPGFSFGYRYGAIVIAAQLGMAVGQLDDTDGASLSASMIHLMRMIYYDAWTSADGRARLNLVGGLGFGTGTITDQPAPGGGGTTQEVTATFIPVLAGIGGDYYLHRNFALGVEAGAEVPILTSVEEDGMEILSGGAMALRGMIRITFVTGE